MKAHFKCILIDNHDSFVFNLYRYLNELMPGAILIMKNDEIDYDRIREAEMIVISPGPDIPKNAGKLMDVLLEFHDKKPILGICLGHQAIIEFFGGKLIKLKTVYHGIQSKIHVNDPDDILYKDIESPFKAGRYHSWAADKRNLPTELIITATDEDGQIMGISHAIYSVHGVQFHPESIMTPAGRKILSNFVHNHKATTFIEQNKTMPER